MFIEVLFTKDFSTTEIKPMSLKVKNTSRFQNNSAAVILKEVGMTELHSPSGHTYIQLGSRLFQTL